MEASADRAATTHSKGLWARAMGSAPANSPQSSVRLRSLGRSLVRHRAA